MRRRAGGWARESSRLNGIRIPGILKRNLESLFCNKPHGIPSFCAWLRWPPTTQWGGKGPPKRARRNLAAKKEEVAMDSSGAPPPAPSTSNAEGKKPVAPKPEETEEYTYVKERDDEATLEEEEKLDQGDVKVRVQG